MSSPLLILLFGIGVFLICRFIYKKYKHNKREKVYESENPIDTKNFTFEKAVESCCAAIEQILQLDKEMGSVFTKIENKKKSSNMLNLFLNSGVYKKNKNYPESKKNRKYRISYQRILNIGAIMIIACMLLPMTLPFIELKNSGILPVFIILAALVGVFAYVIYLIVMVPREIRKEFSLYPWHFNLLPLGSQMYILREQWFNACEKTQRLYYDIYLPCKRKADELVDSKNITSNHYEAYQEILLFESDIYNCTPIIRIRKHNKEIGRKQTKVFGAIMAVAAIAGVAVLGSALSNAGKDLGSRFVDKKE